MRIISLLPAATEVVAALGLGENLVARSHECDYPAQILRLPACTAREIEVTDSTPGIQLRAIGPDYRSLSPFNVDWDLLRGLRPSHLLTQTVCADCAVSADDLERVLAKELFELPVVVSLEARTFAGVLAEIQALGRILGAPEAGDALLRSLQSRVEKVESIARASREGISASTPAAPTVACLEWLQPLMLGGTWIPEMIHLAGGAPVGGADGEKSPWLDWPGLLALDPDVVVCMPCGWLLPKAIEQTRRLSARPEWRQLRAVREGNVYVADGSNYFNRPGPRLVDSLEILAEILHPEKFPPVYKGRAWSRFDGV